MWAFTGLGFFSIVKKEGCLHVRARVKKDLQNLLKKTGIETEILTYPYADYRFRIKVDSAQLGIIFSALLSSIDYSNFKSMISTTPDQRNKSSAYHKVWSLMSDLQERG